jgi:alpha-L-rhamnosidase
VPRDLTVEYADRPLGLDEPRPRLAWRSQVQKQTAYQVRVATSPQGWSNARHLVWDSGRTNSPGNTQIEYLGQPLTSRTRYFWQVRVWDEHATPSAWSPASWWEMGLLAADDWTAQWIGGRQNLDHDWGDFTATFDFTLTGGALNFLFRARPVGKTYGETYNWQIAAAGGKAILRAQLRRYPGGANSSTKLTTLKEVELAGIDAQQFRSQRHQLVIEATGSQIKTSLDQTLVDTLVDGTHKSGTIGFLTADVRGALIHRVSVAAAGKSVFETAFADNTNPFTGGTSTKDGLLVAAGAPGKDIVLPIATPAPLLRRNFVAARTEIERARLYVAAGGWPSITLNGRPVGASALENGFTAYDRRVLYRTYDVTSAVKRGDNALAVELGRGWFGMVDPSEWYWHMAGWHGQPRLRVQLEVTLADGRREVLNSDDSWRAIDGPTTFDSVYGGEHHDARLAPAGWRQASFDDHAWSSAALVDGPAGTLVSAHLEPIKTVGTIKPLAITEPKPGVYVFDFGRIFAGTVQLHVTGQRGQAVALIHTEKLRGDGTVDPEQRLIDTQIQTDRYTLSGGGPEGWMPSFSYKGFRYVQVEGLPRRPTLSALVGQVIHSSLASTGDFSSSQDLLNKIQQAARNTLGNNTHGFVTDTPTYEKNGWTGDAQASSLAAVLNFDMARVWTKWLADFRDAQSAKGEVPEIVPTTEYYGYERTPGWDVVQGPTPSWDAATFVLPWEMYIHYGDRRILERMYDTHKKLVDYTGTVISSANGYTHNRGLGEYAGTGPAGPTDATAVAYFYFMTDRLAKSAELLDKAVDTAKYRALANDIRAAYNARYWDSEQMIYRTKGLPYSQTQNTLPVAFGMVPDGHEGAVVNHLNDDIVARKYHLTAGVYAARFLLTILSDHDHADTAYAVATQTTEPSWGWWVKNGHATMFEGWSLNARSYDHHYWSVVSSWFFQSLAGIRPGAGPDQVGYKTLVVKPTVPKGLARASATLATLRGTIESSWTHDASGKFQLRVVVPSNTSAEVWVPSNGSRPATPPGASFIKLADRYAVYSMLAGQAIFVSRF